jgi:hypothetical protein
MAALGIGEGAEVRVSRVALPPAHTVVLQPHSTTFHAVADFTDLGPREFLEPGHRAKRLQVSVLAQVFGIGPTAFDGGSQAG